MVRLRLRRMGRKKAPSYRIVAADARSPRDGRFIEIVGHYNPMKDPAILHIDEEKALKWLKTGAQPTEAARSLLRKAGVLRKFHEFRVARKSSLSENQETNTEVATAGEITSA